MRDHACIDHIEHAMVRRAIITHKTSAIDSDDHVLARECHIDYQLIDRTLHERGIERHHRLLSPDGKTCRHGNRVLFSDAHIEARAIGHSGSDHHDRIILGRFSLQGLGKRLGIGKIAAYLLLYLPGFKVIGSHTVEPGRVLFGRRIALALLRDHMHEHWRVRRECILDSCLYRRDVMSIDRRRADDAQLLEEHRIGNDQILH